MSEVKQKSRTALVASAIRKELKALGLKVESVRGRNSESVVAEFIDLAPSKHKAVEDVILKYKLGHFCGLDDSYRMDNVNHDLPQIRFVRATFNYSHEMAQKAYDVLRQGVKEALPSSWGDLNDYEMQNKVYQFLRGVTEQDKLHLVWGD